MLSRLSDTDSTLTNVRLHSSRATTTDYDRCLNDNVDSQQQLGSHRHSAKLNNAHNASSRNSRQPHGAATSGLGCAHQHDDTRHKGPNVSTRLVSRLSSCVSSSSAAASCLRTLVYLTVILCVLSSQANAQSHREISDNYHGLAMRDDLHANALEGRLAVPKQNRRTRMRIERRQACTESSCATTSPTVEKRKSPDSTSNTRGSGPTSSLLAAPSSAPANLPHAFDTTLGNNFTDSKCEDLFYSFVQDPSFLACHPLSFLLKTSKSFFDASKSLVSLTRTLDASCGVDFNQCSSVMSTLSDRLHSDCSSDLSQQNPLVTQALQGAEAFETMYQVGCLKDDEGSYCFADAITNYDSPTDAFVYYLPSGQALPAGTRPTCNSCLKRTMAVFASAASNPTQPINQVYFSSAQQVNVACGPEFADTAAVALPSHQDGAAATLLPGTGMLALTLTFLVSQLLC